MAAQRRKNVGGRQALEKIGRAAPKKILGSIVFKIFPRKQGTFPALFFGFRRAALFFETHFFGFDQKKHLFGHYFLNVCT